MPVRIGILRIVAVREEGNRNRQAALALLICTPKRLSPTHSAGPARARLHVLTRSPSLRATVAASDATSLSDSPRAEHASNALSCGGFQLARFSYAGGMSEADGAVSTTAESDPGTKPIHAEFSQGTAG